MKIKSYLLAGLALFAMASCDDSFNDWAQQATNTQKDAITFGNGTINEVGLIDFANIPETTDSVQVCTISAAPTSSSATYKPSYSIIFSYTDPVKGSVSESTLNMSKDGKVALSDLKSYIEATYGKRPVERDLSSVARVTFSNGATATYLNSDNFTVRVKPTAPELSEVGYYFVGNVKGAAKADGSYGWNAEDTQFKYEFAGASPYDYPEFTIRVPAQQLTYGDHLEFKILDLAKKGDWNAATVLSGDGNTTELTTDEKKPVEARLFDNQNGQGGNIQFAGTTKQYYVIHVNLLDHTAYATAEDIPQLFLTGSYKGYDWGKKWMELTQVNGNDNLFWTIKYFDKNEEFKFAPQADRGNDFSPVCDGGDQASHFSTPGNVQCDQAGWYLIVVDRAKKTFKAYTPKVYLMGNTSTDGWNARTDADLFSTPADRDGAFVSPALLNGDPVRIYVEIPESDWWKAEFGVAANKSIQYRGNSGSDGASFTSGAGKKVYLNFSTETGDIK